MKLYDQYPYEKEFEAHVISCKKSKQGYDVVLNQTLFFPEEGGQNCDKGTINDIVVRYVSINDDVIHHYLDSPVEGKVKGCIDFAYRYNNMQNHSGEHILSGLIHSLYGFNNVGFHLGDNEITADYDGFLTKEQLNNIEARVNQIIYDHIPIHCYYPDNIDELEYRSKKEILGKTRIAEISGVDVCACCAPHVHSTSEIGVFKIIKAIKHKQGIRVYFLCGQKAIEDYKLKHEEVSSISALLSSPAYEVADNVQRVINELNELKQMISSLKRQMIDMKCQSLNHEAIHIVFVDDIDRSLQQYYINCLLLKSDKMAAVFSGKDNNYRFMLASKEDAREDLNLLKKQFVVKGGGKKDMVQGTIKATKQELLAILKNKN